MSSTFTRMRLGIAAAAVLMIAGGLGTAALLSRHDGTAPPRTWWDAPSAVTERPAKVWTWKPTTAADTIVPLDVADQVLVQAVSTTDMTTTFTALDDDGRASWSATLDGITYYAVAATPQSNLVAVSSYDTEATTVYDVPDGSVAWHARGVYRGSNQNVVSYARDAVLEVADSRTGKKLWSAAADASSFNPTELYTMSGSELDKRDPETGKELWRVDTGLQSDPTAPPQLMALDGFVAASTAEELRAYSDAGDPLWTIPLTSPATWVGPTRIAVAAEAEPESTDLTAAARPSVDPG